MKKLFALLSCIFLSSCSNTKIAIYKDEEPKLNLQEFLNGKIIGYGIVEDYKSRVTKRFNFSGVASWKDQNGEFHEKIVYSDGKEESRVWLLTKINNEKYEATTADVIGKAMIQVSGNAMNWKYTMNVKVNNKTYVLNFDDWMYLMPNGQLINRNYFKKFGITVGELTLFMHKENN